MARAASVAMPGDLRSITGFQLGERWGFAPDEEVEPSLAQDLHHLGGVERAQRVEPESQSLEGWSRSFRGTHRVDQPAMNDSRTFRVRLSTLVSTRTTDCHVPRVMRPATTGMVRLGETNAGSTWSRP